MNKKNNIFFNLRVSHVQVKVVLGLTFARKKYNLSKVGYFHI
jgi:hypothetical protein